jgi:hypothetical protein
MNSTVMEIQDQSLMQYLLGNLPETDSERLDELSVSDDMLAMRLWDAENDLVDAYVRQELSAANHQRFKSHYLTTPRRLRKVQFAESLLRLNQSGNNVTTLLRPPPTATIARSGSPRRWQMALAAGVVLAVAAGFALDDLRIRQQFASSTASLRDLTSQVRSGAQELDAQKKRTTALAADTQRLETLISELRTANAAAGGVKTLLVRVASFLLLPPKRGLEVATVLAVPADAQQIEIRLLLEDNEFAHYRVNIKSRGSATSLWQSPMLSPEVGAQGASLKINVQAMTLMPGAYTVEITGIAKKGAERVASYAVSIVGST